MSVTVTSTTTTTFNPVSSFYNLQHTVFPISTNFPVAFYSPLRYNGAKLLGFVPRAITSQDQDLHTRDHTLLKPILVINLELNAEGTLALCQEACPSFSARIHSVPEFRGGKLTQLLFNGSKWIGISTISDEKSNQ